MSKRIALLRAVNVGGTGKLPMADLRAVAEGLGFTQVQTLLQSGNLVFEAGSDADADLEHRLAQALRERLGVITDIVLRDAGAWAALVAANPMAAEAQAHPSHFLVLVLGAPATDRQIGALRAAAKGAERLEATDGALYISLPDGIGTSRLGTLLSRADGLKATGRNWNTVMKLAALVAG